MLLFQMLFYDILLISCLLTGSLLIRKDWPIEYKLLVVLSGLTLLTETTVQISHHLFKVIIYWLYNLFLPVECVFFIYILYRAAANPVIKRLNIGLLLLLPVGIAILYWLYPFFHKANDHVVLLYLFAELIASCSFLIDIIIDKSNTLLTRHPLFWMTFGLCMYSGLYIVLHSLSGYLHETTMLRLFYMLDTLIPNFILYSGFIICFLRLHKAKPMQNPG
jgi:hypothetical protein